MRNHFDSSDYLKEDFDWGSEKSASKYYRYSMSECYKYYSSYFRSVWDFEEVFHITMEKLNKVVYEQPEKLKKVEDTLKFTMTVFKNSAIDYIKRKGKFYNELNEEDIIEEDGMVLEPVASKNMGIDEVFMKMDARKTTLKFFHLISISFTMLLKKQFLMNQMTKVLNNP